jgi:hypothetical protein
MVVNPMGQWRQNNHMGRHSLPETCRECFLEALATGAPICLYAQCHGKAWQATYLEREQLREYLEAAKFFAITTRT